MDDGEVGRLRSMVPNLSNLQSYALALFRLFAEVPAAWMVGEMAPRPEAGRSAGRTGDAAAAGWGFYEIKSWGLSFGVGGLGAGARGVTGGGGVRCGRYDLRCRSTSVYSPYSSQGTTDTQIQGDTDEQLCDLRITDRRRLVCSHSFLAKTGETLFAQSTRLSPCSAPGTSPLGTTKA